jgi:DNA-binding response OmpR family regulator
MSAKIIIVEDDLAISQMYRIKFEADGYEVKTAANGKLGLKLVEEMKPDIILLDLMMPEMTGSDMLAELRKNLWAKNIKVIVLTNVSQDEALLSLNNQHIDGFIIKAQYTPSQVVEIVKETLTQKPIVKS